jgi:cytochrome c oxidase subunit IV
LADQHAHEQEHDESHGAGRYYVSFAALFVFTVLTYGLHHVNLGAAALPVAMLIAFTKAMVVILFFMHLWDHPGVNRLVMGVTILFLFFAIIMVFADTFTRFPLASPHFEAGPYPPGNVGAPAAHH